MKGAEGDGPLAAAASSSSSSLEAAAAQRRGGHVAMLECLQVAARAYAVRGLPGDKGRALGATRRGSRSRSALWGPATTR